MQVNNTQDYISQKKRQIIAKSISVASPQQKSRTNQLYLAVAGNGADQYNRFVSAPGRNNIYGAPLGKTFTSVCCKPANASTLTYTPPAGYTTIGPYLA
jgi:hypothetical protein